MIGSSVMCRRSGPARGTGGGSWEHRLGVAVWGGRLGLVLGARLEQQRRNGLGVASGHCPRGASRSAGVRKPALPRSLLPTLFNAPAHLPLTGPAFGLGTSSGARGWPSEVRKARSKATQDGRKGYEGSVRCRAKEQRKQREERKERKAGPGAPTIPRNH